MGYPNSATIGVASTAGAPAAHETPRAAVVTGASIAGIMFASILAVARLKQGWAGTLQVWVGLTGKQTVMVTSLRS